MFRLGQSTSSAFALCALEEDGCQRLFSSNRRLLLSILVLRHDIETV